MLEITKRDIARSDKYTVLVLGGRCSGKTTMLHRLLTSEFLRAYVPTLGAQLYVNSRDAVPFLQATPNKTLAPAVSSSASGSSASQPSQPSKQAPSEKKGLLADVLSDDNGVLYVWDCGGHKRFRPLVQQYYSEAKVGTLWNGVGLAGVMCTMMCCPREFCWSTT